MLSVASSPAVRSRRLASLQFSTTFELLLTCCSVNREPSSLREVAEYVDGGVDWGDVLRLAEHHGVIPLLYKRLRDLPGNLPPAILDDLHRRYESNARRNLQFTAELFRILDALEAHCIAAIPHKGPVLAETVYGDIALRSFSDLDILVSPSDVQPAKPVVEELGYVPVLSLTDAEEHAYLASGYEYSFDGPAGPNLLEIQWGIAPKFYAVDFDCGQMFARAVSANLSGRTVRALCPEDLLLTLCVHAAKHAWSRLCWLRDVAGLLESQIVDWSIVEQRATKFGISRMVQVSLLLAHRLLSANVPHPIRQNSQQDFAVERFCSEVIHHLARGEEYRAESVAYFWFMFRLREGVIDKLRFAFRLIFTPSLGEWRLVRLPQSLFFLYRIIRLGRLLARVF
jgi:putative nucleotidyltransferase-like protein